MNAQKIISSVLMSLALQVSASFVFTTAQASPPPPPPPPYQQPSYAIQQFHQDEQQALYWNQRYSAAPSGSFDEKYARGQRDQMIQRAIYDLQDPRAFEGMNWQELERFVNEMNQRYGAAPSGSAIESMYRQARDLAMTAFTQALLSEVQVMSYDWRQLMPFADMLNQRYGAAPSGSAIERAYDQARRQAYANLPPSVQQEIRQMYDFRQAEQLASYFNNQYAAAPSGSLSENAYNQIRRNAYDAAVEIFRSQAIRMSPDELYRLQAEYDQKYSAAPSGSLQENYARQIRDIARSFLGGNAVGTIGTAH